ncbi:hypothetical protein RB195_010150 [Necator americanus]|uniref:Uncharacterized protein n=1 Tax=Necator americanus TaxID=51031 RepID=A0ABR1CXW7_NECAM
MHGLFSFFKKKPAPKAVTKEETTTRHESFCDVNELMSDETVKKEQHPIEAPKSRKKFAAPSAPDPRSSPTVDHIARDRHDEVKSSQAENPPTAATVQQGTNTEESQKTEDHKVNASEKKSLAVAATHMHEVIHYSPQSTVKSFATPPLPNSEVPYVERRSNIILNDKSGLKTIPVSQFDGTISKQREKKVAAPSPPTSSPALELKSQTLFSPSAKINSVSSPKEAISVNDVHSSDSSVIPREQNSVEENEQLKYATEITHDYETLKTKFDLWQALQAENRNSAEARQLHMEIIYQHDSLMKKLQQTADIAVPTGKGRPSIAPDTFTPWRANRNLAPSPTQNPRMPQNIGSKTRPPALPARWTPTSSSHSLSPTTSTSSEDTDRSLFAGKQSRAVTTRDGLPVSAVPGVTHNILVTRTSVRPKVCIQVTGKCKRCGLEWTPTNKLYLSITRERNVPPKTHGTGDAQPVHGF